MSQMTDGLSVGSAVTFSKESKRLSDVQNSFGRDITP